MARCAATGSSAASGNTFTPLAAIPAKGAPVPPVAAPAAGGAGAPLSAPAAESRAIPAPLPEGAAPGPVPVFSPALGRAAPPGYGRRLSM